MGRLGVQATCSSALEDVLPEMKKMRLLARKQDIPEARIRTKTRKYLLAIGDKIVSLPRDDGLPEREELWDHVSEYTENRNDGETLMKLYGKLDTERVAKEAEGLEDGDEEGAEDGEEDPDAEEEGEEPASTTAAVEDYDEGYDPEADDGDEPDGDDDEDWAA